MKAYRVSGHFKMGHNSNQPFVKEFVAASPQAAKERAYSDLGSRHGVKRLRVHIEKVDALTEDQIETPVARYILARGA